MTCMSEWHVYSGWVNEWDVVSGWYVIIGWVNDMTSVDDLWWVNEWHVISGWYVIIGWVDDMRSVDDLWWVNERHVITHSYYWRNSEATWACIHTLITYHPFTHRMSSADPMRWTVDGMSSVDGVWWVNDMDERITCDRDDSMACDQWMREWHEIGGWRVMSEWMTCDEWMIDM